MQKLSRRKLLKGTVKTAPLLALASSKSVWASSCMSMSGSLSNNFSNKVTYECNGSAGCTPGFWKNHIQAWPKFLFPGIFLFSNDKFKVAWDWTMGSHDYLDGSKKYYGWSDKSLRKYAKMDNHGSYAQTWTALLESMCPSFITKETLWQSLNEGYEGGEKEAEYHMAAALLNAAHSDIDYGYDMVQLLTFCKKAEESSSKQTLHRFIDSIVSLNERGNIDAPEVQTFSTSDLSECFKPEKRASSRSYSVSSFATFESSEASIDTSNIIGDASDYPSTR
ncbi:hypothetical protein I533_13205 [Alteromonas mediterranea MED64]|uniref:hypothetical protein n=1 Tax=Alteromonas mediterranea TaxID=314275 RepID=UPI0003556FD1|nr:hypothetical protein [Alteromonas mediterranea]AGP82601.1 hypothetical protein I533_13205 [Alteromonas mediterranea MED64]